jgi:hypothetical protein
MGMEGTVGHSEDRNNLGVGNFLGGVWVGNTDGMVRPMNESPLSPPTVHLEVIDVGCPACGAQKHEPCVKIGTTTPVKRFHPDRATNRDQLVASATGNDPKARHARWLIRMRGAPRVNLPHGTKAAYDRHRVEGTKPCNACVKAARAHWREEEGRRRERRLAARAAANEAISAQQ